MENRGNDHDHGPSWVYFQMGPCPKHSKRTSRNTNYAEGSFGISGWQGRLMMFVAEVNFQPLLVVSIIIYIYILQMA